MRRSIIGVSLMLVLISSAAAPEFAQAVAHYANCTAMHRDWRHGIAKSRRAADREVHDGYGRPHVSRRIYRANRQLDANDDGVACEA